MSGLGTTGLSVPSMSVNKPHGRVWRTCRNCCSCMSDRLLYCSVHRAQRHMLSAGDLGTIVVLRCDAEHLSLPALFLDAYFSPRRHHTFDLPLAHPALYWLASDAQAGCFSKNGGDGG